MSFLKRHMDMSGGSATMDMSGASATMDMVMETAEAAMSMSHDHTSEEGMGGMHMWFTTHFKDYPVVFETLSASTKGGAFGIFVLLFFAAFFARLLEFVRNYLEEVVWVNPKYQEFENGVVNHRAKLHQTESGGGEGACEPGACGAGQERITTDSLDKNLVSESGNEIHSTTSSHESKKSHIGTASKIMRNVIRLALCIIPDLFSYTLMLAVMTFTLTYFFAVVLGSGIGRFVSERLSEKFSIKRTPPRSCC
ncbi:CTR1 [Candida oxycetoniae]|uniref:Copper transport protein n=1 Tax=Candida oxycetoniae TaxID=497107 RepID=A0AAI9WWM9_9ASCO|nr:CTR1 [Candida oxycetoniae]KAI3402904.2 CTR1 [Candida oxycetoniae]